MKPVIYGECDDVSYCCYALLFVVLRLSGELTDLTKRIMSHLRWDEVGLIPTGAILQYNVKVYN